MKKNMTGKLRKIIAAAVCFALLPGLASCATQTAAENTPEPAEQATAEPEVKTGKRIYFAAPLFSQSEKDFNLQLTKVFEDNGYEVFLPQRDGILAAELEGKSEEEKNKMIFEKDISELMKSDIVVMLLDGRVPDEGACVELGIGYSNGKRCYGIKTDTRSLEIDLDINPMLIGCFTKIFKAYGDGELIEQLEQYLADNEL